jgi:hypothetical protein
MREITTAIKSLASGNLENVQVCARDANTIKSILNTPVYKSEKMRVFPEVDEVEVKEIDALHDEVTLLWSDLKVKGIVTWREGKDFTNNKTYSLVNFE